MLVRVYDIESTGLDPDKDRVIEVASCDAWLDQNIICPPAFQLCFAEEVPPESSAIHHLMAEDLAHERPFDEVWPLFDTDEAAFACAHNADFEKAFLPVKKPWLCTYKCALRLWPEAPGHSNQVLRYWLGDRFKGGRDCGDPHRAGPDAYVTAHILAAMLEESDLETLARWSAEPPLLPYVDFGKHKGQQWGEVPSDYLQWILRQDDMSEALRHTAQVQLKARERSA